jgi:hypothetical protein
MLLSPIHSHALLYWPLRAALLLLVILTERLCETAASAVTVPDAAAPPTPTIAVAVKTMATVTTTPLFLGFLGVIGTGPRPGNVRHFTLTRQRHFTLTATSSSPRYSPSPSEA